MAEEPITPSATPPQAGAEAQPPAGDPAAPADAATDDTDALKGKLDTSVKAEKAARKRAQDAEAELKKLQDASLSEKEKAEKERDEAKAEAEEARNELRKSRGAVAAAKAGIRPSALRMAVAELPADLDMDDPAAIDAAMAQVAKEHPYLKGDGSIDAGARGSGNGAAEGDMDTLIRRAAGRA